jgi:hypothetical protein
MQGMKKRILHNSLRKERILIKTHMRDAVLEDHTGNEILGKFNL